ncbi:MAG: DUF4340 domain-containing protein [Betaproteobacteria bacterium]|nr:DUF4340 domain-containing protein [Betaproteobacteria bacterium]
MKRSTIVNLLLALFVAGLAIWMYERPAGEHGSPEVALSSLKRDDIGRIEVRRTGLPEFVLTKTKDGRWLQEKPFVARTDSGQVGHLLDLATATARQKLSADDLGRFGLDKPAATVTLGTERFEFGIINSVTNEQYVLTSGAVYPVSPVFGYGLPTHPGSFATHMLLADDEIPTGIETPGLSLETKDGKYSLRPAKTGEDELSQDDLARWIEEWRFASSLATQPVESIPHGENVKLTLKNGHTVDFVVSRREPEFTLVRTDEKLRFVFPSEKGARLLAPTRKK